MSTMLIKSTQLGSTNKAKLYRQIKWSQRQASWRMPVLLHSGGTIQIQNVFSPIYRTGGDMKTMCYWPVSESSQGFDVWATKFILKQLMHCTKVFQELLQPFKQNWRTFHYLGLHNTQYTSWRYAIPVTRTETSFAYYELNEMNWYSQVTPGNSVTVNYQFELTHYVSVSLRYNYIVN